AWALPSPPSHRVVIRFTGEKHQEDVDGLLLFGEAAAESEALVTPLSDEGAADGSRPSRETSWRASHKLDLGAWRISCTSPAWPKAELEVALEVSWNGQQFVPVGTSIRFEE
ncbi:unnamed protein product, partial [Polarella glacialis]